MVRDRQERPPHYAFECAIKAEGEYGLKRPQPAPPFSKIANEFECAVAHSDQAIILNTHVLREHWIAILASLDGTIVIACDSAPTIRTGVKLQFNLSGILWITFRRGFQRRRF